MAAFYLMRHGEPEITGVMLGQMDPPLSPTGRIQSAASLAGIHIEVAWTSPLQRARETADLIGARRILELPELREIDVGAWTGKTWDEIQATWGELASRKVTDWLGIPAPEGETWAVFLDRIQSAWKVIRAGPAPAAIVAHQGVNAALMHLIDGRDPLTFNQAYGEVIRFDCD